MGIFDKIIAIEKEKYDQRVERIRKVGSQFRNQDDTFRERGLSEPLRDFTSFDKGSHVDAHNHWMNICFMELYARIDLGEMAQVELDSCNDFFRVLQRDDNPLNIYEAKCRVFENSPKIARLCHSYIFRLATWTDNLYYMVADYYGFDLKKLRKKYGKNMQDEKLIISKELEERNERLGILLSERFGYSNLQREFYELRNAYAHNTPKFYVNTDTDDKGTIQTFCYQGSLLVKGKEREVPVFDHMFGFYERTVPDTVEAMCLMFEIPSEKKR